MDNSIPPAGRFEEDFRAYEREPIPPPGSALVFYGSSSIHMWPHLARDFPGMLALNRGFGGGTLEECVRYFDRLVTPLHPRALVVYAGENDIAEFGAKAGQVRDRLDRLVRLILTRLPDRPFAVISIKPSPGRAEFLAEMLRANDLIRQALGPVARAGFIDIVPAMMDGDGRPRGNLFSADGYHMADAGYLIWRTKVREWLGTLSL